MTEPWTTINQKQFHAILNRINNWFAKQEDTIIVYSINDIPFITQDKDNNINCHPVVALFWGNFLNVKS